VADHYWAILHLSAGSHTNGGVLKSLDQRFFKTLESSDWQTALRSAAFSFYVLVLMGGFAWSAPRQLQNKTITASWLVEYALLTPGGAVLKRVVRSQRVIYVSSAGRIFVKQTYDAPGGAGSAEMAPDEKTPSGGARDVRFQGDKIVAMAVLQGGAAGRMVISFDQRFSTCSVEAVIGNSGPGPARIQRRGVSFEVQSTRISGQSCSLRDGNVFANE
jgi:hypothetical protein